MSTAVAKTSVAPAPTTPCEENVPMENYERIEKLEDQVSNLGDELETAESRISDLQDAVSDAYAALDELGDKARDAATAAGGVL